MSSFKVLVIFVVLAGLGAALTGMGWDAEAGEVKSVPFLIAGCVFVALAAAVLLIVLARLGLTLVDVIVFPGGSGEPPPALYKLAEWYIEENRLGEALVEYQKIEKEHPRDLACYTGQIALLAGRMGLVEAARKAARRGLRRLKDPGDRNELQRQFAELTGEELRRGWIC